MLFWRYQDSGELQFALEKHMRTISLLGDRSLSYAYV